MIKKISKLLFVAAIMLFMFVPSFVVAKSDFVIDETGELTSEQLSELNTLCDKLSTEHQADICAVVVNSTQGYDIDDYANMIYEEYGYGQGSNYSGILLTVDMETKTYYFTTDIDGICFNYITDYSIENLGNVFASTYNSYYATGSELY
ncbi:MAG: TPM domain-containing protein, partial [Erysipelotrichia bacterium]|nr:TPM domain-containing protein [Erysipelotrichia bacterium]